MDEDNSICVSKFFLTNREVSILKMVYENVMEKKYGDFSMESSSYKSLMNRGLLEFSETYRNIVLTNISENIFRSGEECGKVEIETEEGKIIVKWIGFVL